MTFLRLATDMLAAYDDRFGGELGVFDYQEGSFLEDFLIDVPLEGWRERDGLLKALQLVLDERFDAEYDERPLKKIITALVCEHNKAIEQMDRWLSVPSKLQLALLT